MTYAEKLSAVRQKCVDANPERKWKAHDPIRGWTYFQPTLADVLLALESKYGLMDEDNTVYEEPLGKFLTRGGWNLRQDNLDQQSTGTISFLYDLLK